MALVPFDPSSSVLAGGQADYQRVDATPDAFGAQIGQGQGQLGQAFGQVSDTAAKTALQLQQTQNALTTDNAVVQFQKTLDAQSYGDPTVPGSKGFLALNGQDAVEGYGNAATAAETARQSIMSSLNPTAAKAFDGASKRLLNSTLEGFGQHYIRSQAQWADDTDNAALDADTNSAVLNKDNPGRFNSALLDTTQTVIKMGQRLGWSPDVIEQQVQEKQSGLNVAVIKAKAISDPITAWNFYRQNQQHLTGDGSIRG